METDAGIGNPELAWAPPIPTIGRGGHRTQVPHGADFNTKLKLYYLEVDSSPDFFVRRVSATFLRRSNLIRKYKTSDIYLSDLHWHDQYQYIRSKMYGSDYSLHFKRKLTLELSRGNLAHIRQWFYTANGVVLPYILGGGDDYKIIDSMTKFVMENCANNYAQFLSSLKLMKKSIRKSAALTGFSQGSSVKVPRNGMTRISYPYLTLFNKVLKESKLTSKEKFRFLLFWTQSRATGLADGKMVEASLNKFWKTVSEPSTPVSIDVDILQSCIRTSNLTGHEAQISSGPKACLQAPQAPVRLDDRDYFDPRRADLVGGQTRYLHYLATHKVLTRVYDVRDFSYVQLEKPRAVRGANDLLSWAVHETITNFSLVGSVRYHAVAEQSKSRSITVAHYAYQVIMGVLAHALTPAVLSAETRSGLKSDRHLWNFLDVSLSPEVPSWEGFAEHKISAMSSDLSEATDHMSWWFGRAVWSEYIRQTRGACQPTALMLLAKKLYTSPRTVYYSAPGNKYSCFRTMRAALMGDLFTKVVLTIAQDYNARKALLDSPIGSLASNKNVARGCMVKPYNLSTLVGTGREDSRPRREIIHGSAYSLVGDDIIILYAVVGSLRETGLLPYFREASTSTDVLISELDSFDSPHLMFYCEEGALVPRGVFDTTRVSRWTGREVNYLDYPRLRLLLPVKMEQDIYSQTNVGRFSLLGKETRWVCETSSALAQQLYECANLVQHLVVPRDIECLCPFTPQAIGGDDAYTVDVHFFSEVIRRKSKDPAETLYRMQCQMVKIWSHHYVSTDKVRYGVMKHHLMLPTLDRLRKFIPERSVVVPPSREHAEIFRSLPRGILESPLLTFMKLVKRCYYGYLFRGKILPNLRVSAELENKRGSTSEAQLWSVFRDEVLEEYLDRWRRPGFSTRDDMPYYVVPYRHKDLLSVNWQWKPRPEPANEFARLSVNDFLDTIYYGKPNTVVTQRLNMFFESDPLILIRVREDPKIDGTIYLISKDLRLGAQVAGFVRSNRSSNSRVYCIHPIIFLLGRLGELPPPTSMIEDAGAINWVGRNAHRYNFREVECYDIRSRVTRYPGVTFVTLDSLAEPKVDKFHLRTEEHEAQRYILLRQGEWETEE
ncbi:RNA-dependent RNA polymerase [Erysiphe necator associated narnavirus 39]|nr:RNA-dependent RNA polymerase [Erysiphe necator associated narnavirus 39]